MYRDELAQRPSSTAQGGRMIGIGAISRGDRSRATTRVLLALFWERKKEERKEERKEDRTLTSLYYQNLLLLLGSPIDQSHPGVRRLHTWGV